MDNQLDKSSLHVFSDFDGTITETDTLVFLTRELGGGPQLVEAMGRLIRSGELSLRNAIIGEMRSLRVPFEEAAEMLEEHVQLDPGFAPFAAWCRTERIPLTVLSAGFREIIDLFIRPAEFPDLEILANNIKCDEQHGWQCVFRDKTDFGHDKSLVLRAARQKGQYVVFIGDGLSDRAPAEVADEVYAKHDLAEYCRSRGINCHEYRKFDEVLSHLRSRMA